LEYNRIRQARITMELCEIISGASAVWTRMIIKLSEQLIIDLIHSISIMPRFDFMSMSLKP
jgi:hypothetical protein